MSEKRFVLCKKGDVEYIEDNCCVQLYGFDVLCEMLNEQQEKITELEIELTDCKNRKEQSEYNLRRENEQLRNKLEVANARSGYYQRMLEKWCVKDE